MRNRDRGVEMLEQYSSVQRTCSRHVRTWCWAPCNYGSARRQISPSIAMRLWWTPREMVRARGLSGGRWMRDTDVMPPT